MNAKDIIADMQNNYYTTVKFPLGKNQIEYAMSTFFNFCNLAAANKEPFWKDIPILMKDGTQGLYGNDKGAGTGYIKKDKKNGDLDCKDIFHFDRNIIRGLEKGIYNLNPTSEIFLNEARKIYDIVIPIIENKIKLLDQEIPGIYEWTFGNGLENSNTTLRFIKYDVKVKNGEIAKGHNDKGIFTLALAESHPGLRFGRKDGVMHEVIHNEHEGLFFPAIHIRDVEKGNILTPTWHDVIQKENLNNDVVSRWALVVFTNPLYLRSNVCHKQTHEKIYA